MVHITERRACWAVLIAAESLLMAFLLAVNAQEESMRKDEQHRNAAMMEYVRTSGEYYGYPATRPIPAAVDGATDEPGEGLTASLGSPASPAWPPASPRECKAAVPPSPRGQIARQPCYPAQ